MNKSMTPTFYREYRQLNRVTGISLHNDVLLYKTIPEKQDAVQPVPPQPERDHRPWKLRLMIFLLVYGFFLWALVEALIR